MTLVRRMAIGGLMLVLLRLTVRMIGLVSTMILFRVLVPDDFGLIALAGVAIGLVEVFAEFGFDLALIRKQNATRKDYDVTWSLTLLRGLLVATIVLALAQPAGSFLNDARLPALLYWMAPIPIIDGLQNPGISDFSKELTFGKEFKLKVSQKIIGFVVTISAALWLRNYWALVIGLLAGRLVGLLLSYIMHDFRPRFSLSGAREVFNFSIWVMFNNVILYAGSQTDKVLIKKYYDAHMVGIFRVAEEICSIVMELVWPVERALFAGYAKQAGNLVEIRQTMLSFVAFVAMLGMPLSILLLIIAEPAVLILLGSNGMPAVPFVQVLCLHSAIRCCIAGIQPVFLPIGKPKITTELAFYSVATRLSLLIILFPIIGAMAAPWSLVAGTSVGCSIAIMKATRVLKLTWWEIPHALWRPIASTAMMFIITSWFNKILIGTWIQQSNITLLISYLGAAGLSLSISLLFFWIISGRPEGPEKKIVTLFVAEFYKFKTAHKIV